MENLKELDFDSMNMDDLEKELCMCLNCCDVLDTIKSKEAEEASYTYFKRYQSISDEIIKRGGVPF